MTPKDQTYFKRRAIEEDHAAIKATSMPVRERHEDMARLYRDRINLGSVRYGELPITGHAPAQRRV